MHATHHVPVRGGEELLARLEVDAQPAKLARVKRFDEDAAGIGVAEAFDHEEPRKRFVHYSHECGSAG